MRSSRMALSCGITLSALIVVAGCSASTDTGGAAAPEPTAPPQGGPAPSASGGDNGGRTPSPGPAGDGGNPTPTSTYDCSGAGIAAFADALVGAGRKSCTSDGVGVVRNDNYQCVEGAIDGLAPPHPDAAYRVVTTLLAPNQDYPDLECTYFIQMVTSGVCGAPLSPKNMAWTDYPYAYEFIDEAPAGWTWIPNNGSSPPVQLGDIFVYDRTNNQDPGHIMIVAEIMGGTRFRLAEANELKSDGSPAFDETGVMSNTRVTSLNDADQRPAGWLRLTP